MKWARQHRRARQIMLVLEEAHTIVPETFGAGFDYDTQWVVSCIGQIALQGRKYGVGCLSSPNGPLLSARRSFPKANSILTLSVTIVSAFLLTHFNT